MHSPRRDQRSSPSFSTPPSLSQSIFFSIYRQDRGRNPLQEDNRAVSLPSKRASPIIPGKSRRRADEIVNPQQPITLRRGERIEEQNSIISIFKDRSHKPLGNHCSQSKLKFSPKSPKFHIIILILLRWKLHLYCIIFNFSHHYYLILLLKSSRFYLDFTSFLLRFPLTYYCNFSEIRSLYYSRHRFQFVSSYLRSRFILPDIRSHRKSRVYSRIECPKRENSGHVARIRSITGR